MKLRVGAFLLLCLVLCFTLPNMVQPALGQEPVVRAVFFYSPTCGHCHMVMTEIFPALQEQYGEQLDILEIDASTDEGQKLYKASTEDFEIPDNRQGVPRLIVGDTVMVGSVEIPEQFPVLIEQLLTAGGIDWPAITGLEDFVPPETIITPGEETWVDRYMRDPAGNTLSVFVLIALVISLLSVIQPAPWQRRFAKRTSPWGVPVVVIIGLIVASYLAYVEVTMTEATCGPIGDCNTVQQSEFVLIFGLLPMAVFGVLGYLAIITVWAYGQFRDDQLAQWAPVGVFALAAFGTAFSTYLTFLEPFVIGATCAWCLTSAVCMALLLLMSAGPGWHVLKPPKQVYGSSKSKKKTKRKQQFSRAN